MNPQILRLFLALFVIPLMAITAFGQISVGSDNANNYTLGQDLNGANGGSGFGAWSVVGNGNATIFSGAFVGNNTTQNGRASIGSPSQVFGLYANPAGAFVDLRRTFSGGLGMAPGNAFSWQGSYSWSGGNRGFSLYSGSDWTGEILNLNHSGSDALTYTVGLSNGTALTNIFNQAFTITLTLVSAGNINLQAVSGTNNFSQNFAISGTPTSFKWYFSGAPDGNGNFEPYINNLSAIPEPSTYALLGLGAASVLWRIRRRRIS
jgi:hypothetical protein